MEMSPSFEAVMYVFNFMMQEQVYKKPRKEFRQITDPWLEAYNKKQQQQGRRQAKTFDSLNEALRDFFREFCQENISWHVDFSKYTLACFHRHPLGLVAICDLLLFFLIMPLFILREYCIGGNLLTFFCKGAAALTINEVYVVCCKENISFDEALHKYPWVQGAFSKRQLHPMIGRAVCPLYRRNVIMPTRDVMNFDVEVLACPTGTALLRQRHDTWWDNFLEDVSLSYGVVLVLGIAFLYLEGLLGVAIVSKYALPFYLTRVLVDHKLTIRWMDRFFYLP